MEKPKERVGNEHEKLGVGAYISLILIILFFSGIMGSLNNWLSFFDFTTLSGKFGLIGAGKGAANFQGAGGDGAKQGFMFAFSLVPVVMLAMGSVAVAESFGAVKAAQRLLTPLLKLLLGIPGEAGLALITSLQSTDASASMTKALKDDGTITEDETTVFCTWQFSSDGIITNFLGTGAALWALVDANGNPAIRISMMIPFVLQLILKFFGANIVRFYLKAKKGSNKAVMQDVTEGADSSVSMVSSEKNYNATAQTIENPKVNPTTTFVSGCNRGLNIGFKSIIPNVLMAFVIIKALNVSGIMNIIGAALAPIMGIFGLPGQASAVLLASFISMGGGVGAAGELFAEGILTGSQVAILSPAMFLMGALLQNSGRLLQVVQVEHKPLLFMVCILNAMLSMFIMNIFI